MLHLWECHEGDDAIHITPLNDADKHTPTPACTCGPAPDSRYGGAWVHKKFIDAGKSPVEFSALQPLTPSTP